MVDWMNPSEDAVIGREVGNDDCQDKIDELNGEAEYLSEKLHTIVFDTLTSVCKNLCVICKQDNTPKKYNFPDRWLHYYKDSLGQEHSYTCTTHIVRDMIEKQKR